MSIETILSEFGKKLVDDLRASLAEKQKVKASKHGTPFNENSQLSRSIKFVIIRNSDSVSVQLFMNDYWKWVDEGRKPGDVSKEGAEKIKKWIRVKGLDAVGIINKFRPKPKTNRAKKLTYPVAAKQLTFLVQRKVKNKGYDANYFFNEVINDGRLEDLAVKIREEVQEEISIELEL